MGDIKLQLAIPVLVLGQFFPVALISTLAAPFLGGGLSFPALSLTLVDENKRRASRWRILARTGLNWFPALCFPVLFYLYRAADWVAGVLGYCLVAVLLGGALWTVLHPNRGWADYIAGSAVVRR